MPANTPKDENGASVAPEPDLHLVQAVILDVETVENIPSDGDNFEILIVISLQEVGTNRIFGLTLGEEQLRRVVGVTAPLSSKQMIDFAEALKHREAPLSVYVPINTEDRDITPDMLMQRNVPAPRQRSVRPNRAARRAAQKGPSPLDDLPAPLKKAVVKKRFGSFKP